MFTLTARVLEKRRTEYEGKSRYFLDCLARERGRSAIISVRVPEQMVELWGAAQADEELEMTVSVYARNDKIYVSVVEDEATRADNAAVAPNPVT